MAQAEVKTFNFTWSGASFGNFASATGFITLDTDLIQQSTPSGSYPTPITMSQIVNLSMTVSGASIGNGNFTKSDFDNVWFNSPSTLDFSRELVGQALSDGGVFATGTGNGFLVNTDPNKFNEFANYAPTSTYWNQIQTQRGQGGDTMKLISMTSVAAVPEADTSAMLLMGAGVMGFIARRRKQAAA
jgi:hypothetical protein